MLSKTEKGRQELRPGVRTLGQRERAMLLLADGNQSETQLAALFSGDGRRLLDLLLREGYLQSDTPDRPERRTPAPAPVETQNTAASRHGEQFTGTRSLATARMFLFDLSERLFAPRDKALALHFRQSLREARDVAAMLAIGREIVARVETLAGSERADGISERLAKLLPEHVLGQTV